VPRLVVVLLFALSSLTLSGCFVSSDPLITPATADHPWTAARAQHFDWVKGKWKPEGHVTVTLDGSYYQLRDDETRDVTRFLLRGIGDNRFIAQAEDLSGTGNAAFTYSLVVIDHEHIYHFSFDKASRRCRVTGIDAAALKLRPYESGCGVASLEALADAFRALERTEELPETMYVVEPGVAP
jgi:hypothetical protein